MVCSLDQLFDHRLELVVLMRRDRGRAADDERRPRLVDQNGIDLVDDGKIIAPLNLLVLARGHAVVAQIIEAEFAIGAVGDVAIVLRPAVGWATDRAGCSQPLARGICKSRPSTRRRGEPDNR